MCRTDGDFKVSRILLDGTVSTTFYDSAKDARRDYHGRDGWPPVECHFAVLMGKIMDTWFIIKKYRRAF